MPCWRQTGLQLGKYLRFKLEVQLQRAVCSTSCSRNPEVTPTHHAPSVLFHPAGCVEQEHNQRCPVILYLYNKKSLTLLNIHTPDYGSKWVNKTPNNIKPLLHVAARENFFLQKYVQSTVCHKIVSKLSLFAKVARDFRDMDVKICCCHTCSFLPAAAQAKTLMNVKQNPPMDPENRRAWMSQSCVWASDFVRSKPNIKKQQVAKQTSRKDTEFKGNKAPKKAAKWHMQLRWQVYFLPLSAEHNLE